MKCLYFVGVIATLLSFTAVSMGTENQIMVVEKSNGCECIDYNCGCCQMLVIEHILNGTLCLNVSYLPKDIGTSLTLTYNNKVIINETVSVVNPPPICVGFEIENVGADVCLYVYAVHINSERFQSCFKVSLVFYHFKLVTTQLGCIDTAIPVVNRASTHKITSTSDFKLKSLMIFLIIIYSCWLPSLF